MANGSMSLCVIENRGWQEWTLWTLWTLWMVWTVRTMGVDHTLERGCVGSYYCQAWRVQEAEELSVGASVL